MATRECSLGASDEFFGDAHARFAGGRGTGCESNK